MGMYIVESAMLIASADTPAPCIMSQLTVCCPTSLPAQRSAAALREPILMYVITSASSWVECVAACRVYCRGTASTAEVLQDGRGWGDDDPPFWVVSQTNMTSSH